MSQTSNSGIKTSSDGASYIPASRRADGSTRKEIKIRPGYKPPEDIETYKSRNVEAWKTRGKGGVPGAESMEDEIGSLPKSKNARRREAARKKTVTEDTNDAELSSSLRATKISDMNETPQNGIDPTEIAAGIPAGDLEELERQKKVRNLLKKLKAVRELKEKRNAGEKLSPDQVMKIGKESEVLRDLDKLGYEGSEMLDSSVDAASG